MKIITILHLHEQHGITEFQFSPFNSKFQRYIINVLHVDSFNVIFTKSLYYRKDSRNDLQLVFKYFRQVKK